MFSHKLLTTHVAISPYGVIFCGRSDSIEFTNLENNEILFGDSFKKCIYKDCVYKSTEYTQSPRRNDTIVKLTSGQVVQIKNIKTELTCDFFVPCTHWL